MDINKDKIISLSVFQHKGEEYLSVFSKNDDGFSKEVIKIDKDKIIFVPETKEMIESEVNSVRLDEKESKKILSSLGKGLNALEKKEETQIKYESKINGTEINEVNFNNYQNIKTAEERNEFLKKAGIEEGKVFEITCKGNFKNEKEMSKAYFEVFKDKKGELRLRLDTKSGFSPTGYNDMIANASRLSGISAIALISDEFAKHKLNAEYQKTGLNNQNFSDYEITFTKKDVTKEAEKKRKELYKYRIEKLKDKRETENSVPNKTKLELIPKVPDTVAEIYKNKNKPVDSEIYTYNVFNMFKKIAAVAPEDQNISNFDKKIFKDLIGKMSKFNGNEDKQRAVFNQWIFDNKTTDRMVNIANLFEKTHKENFKGYEIKRSEITKHNRDENLEAIKADKLPIMFTQDSVDYIYNPENNKIFSGNSQIALHRNNNLENISTDTYVELPQMLLQNKDFNTKKKLKCELVDAGFDEFGRKHFQMLVPCKPSRAELKKEKELRKEEYRRNISDAKYLKKYGELPVYTTSLQPIPHVQPPLANKSDLKNFFERPTKESSIEDKLKYDYTNFFISMMTKEKFEPATKWTDKEQKAELVKFAKENPEKLERIQADSYEQVRNQTVNTYSKNRENTAQNELVNQNTSSRSNRR